MKRRIAFLTAICMLAFSVSALADGFSDMPAKDSTYYTAFEYAVNNGIISGVDGKLLPDNPVTRAEAITFISRAKSLGSEGADMSKIADVPQNAWYYTPMSLALKQGLIAPDSANMLYPTQALTRRAAWDLLVKAFGVSAYTPVTEGDKAATRADFILWLYSFIPVTTPVQPPTDSATEATEISGNYTDIKAQLAQEAMQLALGIRADGTSYVTVNAYKDTSNTDWATGKVDSSSSSSRPSTKPGNSSDNEPDDEPTNAPTEDGEADAPTNEPTTNEPDEPETPEPTYGELGDDVEIKNENDNTVDDPFTDDDWNNNSGSSGDKEEDDFVIDDANDADEPSDEPSDEESSTEPTDEPSDEESSAEPTDEPSDEESSNEPSDEPSDEESSTEPTDEPSDEESSNEPSDEPSDEPTDEAIAPPKEEEGSSDEKESDDEAATEPGTPDEGAAALTTKVWWFN